MGAYRDDYSDAERNPDDLVLAKKDCGDFYEMNVSTLANEWQGFGWKQITKPYPPPGNPLEAAGTAGAVHNADIAEEYKQTPTGSAAYNASATSDQSGMT